MRRTLSMDKWKSTVSTGQPRQHERDYWFRMCYAADGDTPSPTVEDGMKMFSGTTQKSRTNLMTDSKIPNHSNFCVHAFSCYLDFEGTNALSNWRGSIRELYFEFKANDRVQWEGFARNIPAGGGMWSAYVATATTFIANNGVPSPSSLKLLSEPIVLTAGQEFELLAKFKQTPTASSLITNLAGSSGIREITVTMHGEELTTAS